MYRVWQIRYTFSKNSIMLLKDLLQTIPQVGEVTWIGIRPARRAPVQQVVEVMATAETGLTGDHYAGTYSKNRQVTLIQAEHLPAVASLSGHASVDPALLRRNIVVRGINLLALKDARFQIGDAILKMTGLCHPCSRMEEVLGAGGYNAMRGHGGITASVVKSGLIKTGDRVQLLAG
jgi:MOSC domain-containing protein YiiM